MSIAYLLITANTYGYTVHDALSSTRTKPITSRTLNNQHKSLHDYLNSANAAHLLDTDHYDEDQQREAKISIAALTNAINPLAILDFKRLSQLKREELKIVLDKNRPYIGLVQLYNAIQNLGLTNLQTIYKQRIATQPHTQSPLAQDKIRALHRIQDPEWKAQLRQADSVALQRQTLELMADQLAETHQTRITLERLLATASVSLLQTNTLLRSTIEEQAKQVVGN